MAKEFKDWDKAFSRAEIDLCRREWLFGHDELQWNYGYNQPGVEEARHAVYEADGHVDWQKFRVAMKGANTVDKLRMLHNRWLKKVSGRTDEQAGLEKTRIWNYIGALRRGGQLDRNLIAVK